MKILVTGTAGFIGYHLTHKLVTQGDEVIGIDNINDYYDVNLKLARLADLGIDKADIEYNVIAKSSKYKNLSFVKLDLVDNANISKLFLQQKFDKVCNLAAQAGVRYSLSNPHTYIDSNISGFLNILEGCRYNNIQHLVYASSSSVYGSNTKMPFSTSDNIDHPISLYAASKKANELMAHSYSHLFGIPTTGLRFFSAYGPWGRPDMALFIFTKNIIEGKAIDVYNNGDMHRDFTYVDDIVEGIARLMNKIPTPDPNYSTDRPNPASSYLPYKVYNIGNNNPIRLMDFIQLIEKEVGKKAIMNMKPMQAGDVPKSWADVDDLYNTIDFKPSTTNQYGVEQFVKWYMEYHNLNK